MHKALVAPQWAWAHILGVRENEGGFDALGSLWLGGRIGAQPGAWGAGARAWAIDLPERASGSWRRLLNLSNIIGVYSLL